MPWTLTPTVRATERNNHYTHITGKLKNKALVELNKFVEQGVIDKKGKGVRLVFVKRVANDTE